MACVDDIWIVRGESAWDSGSGLAWVAHGAGREHEGMVTMRWYWHGRAQGQGQGQTARKSANQHGECIARRQGTLELMF